MSDTTILHPTDAAHLLSQGLLDKCTTTGSQRLHKRRFNSLSDDEDSKIPLNVSLESEAADDAFISIPASLISYETLRWVGLSEAKATEVWGQWLDWPSDGIQREVDPDDGGLQIYLTSSSSVTPAMKPPPPPTMTTTKPGRPAWKRTGWTAKLSRPSWTPTSATFFGQNRPFWAKNTIEVRYGGLQHAQATSRGRAMALQRRAAGPDNKDHDGQGSKVETSQIISPGDL